jgi:hypothetical protein
MHFRDFNAVAAELREGDKLRLELNGGGEVVGELNGSVTLGSPLRDGEITLHVGDDNRRVTAKELSAIDLVQ